jgi:hypothetical protein
MWLALGIAAAVVPLPLLSADTKLVITWLVFVALGSAYALYRRSVGQEMIVAFLFALVITSSQQYVYDTPNLLVGHINLYPLIVWTAGLVALREVYERIHLPYRWLISSALFLAALFMVEYVGYYFLGIRIAGQYPSLLGTGVIHGPPVIHLFYLLAGPLYLHATSYLRVR